MSRYKTMMLAMFAIFAVSAMMVANASALEWLVGGVAISGTTTVPVTVTGELLLEDMVAGTDVLCSGFLDGIVEANGFDLIQKILALDGVTEANIVCSFILAGGCSAALQAPLVTAVDLPWLTELFQDVAGGLVVDLIKEDEAHGPPGYAVDCISALGILVEDVCTGESSADVKNNLGATEVEAEFSHTDELVTIPGNCTIGGAKAGLVGSEDEPSLMLSLIKTNSGAALAFN